MANQREYGRHHEFIDRKGQLVRATREGPMPLGRAYGFFECKASKQEIEAELPKIRKLAETPSELELSLMEGIEDLKGDNDLVNIAREVRKSGANYVVEAKYPRATNEETAKELTAILNIAYSSPLYENMRNFVREIVYKDKGKYVFME